jgi:hypothetical protein
MNNNNNNNSLPTIFISSLLLTLVLGTGLFILVKRELNTMKQRVNHDEQTIKLHQQQLEQENKRLQEQITTLIMLQKQSTNNTDDHYNSSNNNTKTILGTNKEIESWTNIQIQSWVSTTLNNANIKQELIHETNQCFKSIPDGKSFIDLIINDAHHLSLNDRLFFLGCDNSIIGILSESAEKLVKLKN